MNGARARLDAVAGVALIAAVVDRIFLDGIDCRPAGRGSRRGAACRLAAARGGDIRADSASGGLSAGGLIGSGIGSPGGGRFLAYGFFRSFSERDVDPGIDFPLILGGLGRPAVMRQSLRVGGSFVGGWGGPVR